MNTSHKHSALILHINETLDADQHRDLITAVSGNEGVERAGSPANDSHLLVVEFDPAATDSSAILRRARRQSLEVQRVG